MVYREHNLPKGRTMRHSWPLVVVAALLTGCDVPSQIDVDAALTTANLAVEAATDAVEQAQATRAEVAASVETMDPGPERDAWNDRLASVETGLAKAEENLTVATATVDALQEAIEGKVGIDAIEAVAPVVAPLLPAPWGAVGAGVLGLGLGLIRAWRQRAAGLSVVRAIESAKAPDAVNGAGMVDFSHVETKRVLDTAMTGAAKRLVAEGRGDRSSLPF